MDFELQPQQARLRDLARQVAHDHLAAYTATMDRDAVFPTARRAGRSWGKPQNSDKMTCAIHLSLEPGEVPYARQTTTRHFSR
jgi:hypothetical protein